MKILYFDNLNYCDCADLVSCPHCDNDNKADAMLVPTGMESCPLCGEPTMWKKENPDEYEVSLEEIFKTNEIIHVIANYDEEYDDMSDEPVLIPLRKD